MRAFLGVQLETKLYRRCNVYGSHSNSYAQMLQDMSMKHIVPCVTRTNKTSDRAGPGSLIDHVIVPATDDVTTTEVIPTSCNDHNLVIAETHLQRERRHRTEITVRSTRSLEPDALRLDLLTADWSGVREAAGVGDKWTDSHCLYGHR